MPPLTRLLRDHLAANPDQWGKPMSAREAARRSGDEQKYETFRLIVNGSHSGRIEEDTVAALVRLGLRERDVRRAAGHQVEISPGPFELPARANRLTQQQRNVVVAVVDAILAAAEGDHRDRPSELASPDVREREKQLRAGDQRRQRLRKELGGGRDPAPQRESRRGSERRGGAAAG